MPFLHLFFYRAALVPANPGQNHPQSALNPRLESAGICFPCFLVPFSEETKSEAPLGHGSCGEISSYVAWFWGFWFTPPIQGFSQCG